MADTPHASAADLAQAHRRLDAHEGRITRVETRMAVSEERYDHIRASLDKIENGQTWITRLILAGFAAALIGFVVKGGLNVVP